MRLPFMQQRGVNNTHTPIFTKKKQKQRKDKPKKQTNMGAMGLKLPERKLSYCYYF